MSDPERFSNNGSSDGATPVEAGRPVPSAEDKETSGEDAIQQLIAKVKELCDPEASGVRRDELGRLRRSLPKADNELQLTYMPEDDPRLGEDRFARALVSVNGLFHRQQPIEGIPGIPPGMYLGVSGFYIDRETGKPMDRIAIFPMDVPPQEVSPGIRRTKQLLATQAEASAEKAGEVLNVIAQLER